MGGGHCRGRGKTRSDREMNVIEMHDVEDTSINKKEAKIRNTYKSQELRFPWPAMDRDIYLWTSCSLSKQQNTCPCTVIPAFFFLETSEMIASEAASLLAGAEPGTANSFSYHGKCAAKPKVWITLKDDHMRSFWKNTR